MATSARAEVFLGEEGDTATDQSAPPARKRVEPAPKKAKARAAEPEPEDLGDDTDANSSDNIALSGGLSSGSGNLGGHITVSYSLHKFVGLDTTYHYFQYRSGDNASTFYGPEFDLILRYPNRTIVTPFIGAGPGFEKWIREYKGDSFDEGTSLTINQFGGINIRLSRHFGLQIIRKQVTYVDDPPKQFSDRASREQRTTVTTDVGFYAAF